MNTIQKYGSVTALVSFTSPGSPGIKYGIGRVEEIVYINGEWKTGRRLNGDETHPGAGPAAAYG